MNVKLLSDMLCALTQKSGYPQQETAFQPPCIKIVSQQENVWPLLLALEHTPNLPPWHLYLAEADKELLEHPYLKTWVTAGKLLAGVPEPGDGLLVLISNGALAALPQQPLSIQYGNLWQAPSLDAASDNWQPAKVPEHWQAVVEEYQQLLTCSDFTLPIAADQYLDNLASHWPGGVLVLATQHATSHLYQLRAGGIHQRPFNLDALARQQSAKGALCFIKEQADGQSLYLSWRGGSHFAAAFDALCHATEQQGDANPRALLAIAKQCPEAISQQDLLPQWLALSHYDPAFLMALPELVLSAPEPWHENSIEAWRRALVKTWQHYLPLAENSECLFRFCQLFEVTGQWGLLRDALNWVNHFYQPHPDWLVLLAACEAATGCLQLAVDIQRQALALAPENAALAQQLSQYQQRLSAQKKLAAVCQDSELALRLEPLGPQHCDSVIWQYRDPQIAIMTGLEAPTETNDWPAQHYDNADKRSFALMHLHYGFVGVVAYELRGQAAYISYWLGTDFQGLGLSEPALALLAHQAGHQGAAVLFTSVYTCNGRSLRALEKAQFQQMAMAPTQEQPMYYFAKQLDNQVSLDDKALKVMLKRLCQSLGCPLPKPAFAASA
ncbi:GNAT family N-acetyltransferase [Gallaecimonas mangrovi]|uniref:GNAT family N-acetyltransferase n=1 Tax=Gallaecimonas mangrovi TaxID=2291597 RepID=UPI000E2065EC|nr:GNAT family N-acetyltransferase [Gallaecimonas mangrovi]